MTSRTVRAVTLTEAERATRSLPAPRGKVRTAPTESPRSRVCYLQSKDAPRDASLALATSSALADLCRRSSLNLAFEAHWEVFSRFAFTHPKASACAPRIVSRAPCHDGAVTYEGRDCRSEEREEVAARAAAAALRSHLDWFWPAVQARRCNFPDKSSVERECGKLQRLKSLLVERKRTGHRCVIFTQMSRMLDILEEFLCLHQWTYLRLDGSTRVDRRQSLVERFNYDTRIFLFIASTRAGGVGLNLTGADTVIFYDSDWNPAMDSQAMDRCHRIGQTKDVHIYRLICNHTVEENILRKQRVKRKLDEVVVDQGEFTTETLKALSTKDVWEILQSDARKPLQKSASSSIYGSTVLHVAEDAALEATEDAEDAAALRRAEREEREVGAADVAAPEEEGLAGAAVAPDGAAAPRAGIAGLPRIAQWALRQVDRRSRTDTEQAVGGPPGTVPRLA